MRIEIRDHVASVATTAGQVTQNDTILELHGSTAQATKILEFCVEKGKFGKIETHIPFDVSRREADSIKGIIDKIKTKKEYKYIDFRNPMPGQAVKEREYDYCDVRIAETGTSEVLQFSVKKNDSVIAELSKFYMANFLNYIKVDKLKLS